MSADIILYALVAAGLVFWLKTIIGTEDEDDQHSSFNDPENQRAADKRKNDAEKASAALKKLGIESNIVDLNPTQAGGAFALPSYIRIDNKTTENFLEDVLKIHPDFNLSHFASGAEGAFTLVIEAFAEGDLETLESLLKPDVYDAFKGVIEERTARGETVETNVKSIDKMDITEARIIDDVFYITVRFTARETCIIRDAQGQIISGEAGRTTQMVDVWVFSRDLEAGGPEWYLAETRDDEIEDHKTPIPEAGKKGE